MESGRGWVDSLESWRLEIEIDILGMVFLFFVQLQGLNAVKFQRKAQIVRRWFG